MKVAYQFAVLHTAKKKGDARLLPVVVDFPRRQGQDAELHRQTRADGKQLVFTVEGSTDDLAIQGVVIKFQTFMAFLNAAVFVGAISTELLQSLTITILDGVVQRSQSDDGNRLNKQPTRHHGKKRRNCICVIL